MNNNNNSAPDILYHLAIVAPIIPFPVYWSNTESRVLGANQACINAMGATHADQIIGKTPYEYYPEEIANSIVSHVRQVIQTNKTLIQEDMIQDISTGKTRYYAAIRSPLMNADGEIIGVIGTSVEITKEKEAEQLKIEREAQKTILQEQEIFRKIVGQAVHDIRSPLTSLAMMLEAGLELPEENRNTLKAIATRINDIAVHLLSHYRLEGTEAGLTEKRQPLPIVPALLDILAEKRYQYQNREISFTTDIKPGCHFVCAELEESEFKRMLSNLINNAVDAFDDQPGLVTLGFAADESLIKITVQDNGKGMSEALIDKILNNIAVTEEKENGHGIGMVQVHEMLQRNQGTFAIDSKIGKGTTIHLTFLRSCTPDWITKQIVINSNDTVVIMDDEPTIHNAWNARFKAIAPDILCMHFEQADEALAFINGFAQKERLFLLTDYELLKQSYNGLDIIEQTQIKRAVLTTSHYAKQHIQGKVRQLGVTILPKQLAAEIPIKPIKIEQTSTQETTLRTVHCVMVDDDKRFLDLLDKCLSAGRTIDKYNDPHDFLDKITHYPKTTKICLDNHFSGTAITGVEIARKLHSTGYTHLYLLSGNYLDNAELPDYLTFVSKLDIGKIKEILK